MKNKPNKLLKFLGKLFEPSPPPQQSGPALYSATLAIDVDQCCLESFTFAVQTMIQTETLSPNQVRCLANMVGQFSNQVPADVRQLMLNASRYAAKQIEDRQQEKLFAAAMMSPSRN